MSWLDAFHYRSYGAFFLQETTIIPGVWDPPTKIIEPQNNTKSSDSGMSFLFTVFV